MKAETFKLELITPCFCGGAEPEKQAEIRAPSIRGQLRWWFRTLGGFKSLDPMPVRDQEALIFGSTAGDEGRAGKVILRVCSATCGSSLNSTTVKDADQLGAPVQHPKGYVLFPLRSNPKKGVYSGKGVFDGGKLPRFNLRVTWKGAPAQWRDLDALIGIWGSLGGLGFRQRRAMGAVAFAGQTPSIPACLERFRSAKAILVKSLPASDAESAIVALATWLKGWRSHGRTVDHSHAQHPNPPHNPGFDPYAMNDHDRGADSLCRRGSRNDHTFRPALGLPIIQRFQSGGTVNWEYEWDGEKRKAKGRFASPVLLRPHRDAQGKWHALVIFVDAHQWPNDPATGHPKQVFLNGQPRAVSLDLYEAMKADTALEPFP